MTMAVAGAGLRAPGGARRPWPWPRAVRAFTRLVQRRLPRPLVAEKQGHTRPRRFLVGARHRRALRAAWESEAPDPAGENVVIGGARPRRGRQLDVPGIVVVGSVDVLAAAHRQVPLRLQQPGSSAFAAAAPDRDHQRRVPDRPRRRRPTWRRPRSHPSGARSAARRSTSPGSPMRGPPARNRDEVDHAPLRDGRRSGSRETATELPG